MKFTSEQAIESLKRQLTNNGRKPLRMSEKTLTKVVDALLPAFADEETGLPDFETKALEILNPVNDNIGKDKSDFIKKWTDENGEKTPPSNTETPPAAAPTESPEMKALMERLKALEEKEAAATKAASLKEKRQALAAELKNKGVKDDEWINGLLDNVSITEDMDVAAKADTYLKIYNRGNASTPPSVTPNTPGGAPQGGVSESLRQASEMAKLRREQENI